MSERKEMSKSGIRSCSNCHFSNTIRKDCFDRCFDDPEHPDWSPQTNGDRVRQMTDDELEKLWGIQKFGDEYLPECADKNGECQYWNYTCELCPATFRKWLEGVADVDE